VPDHHGNVVTEPVESCTQFTRQSRHLRPLFGAHVHVTRLSRISRLLPIFLKLIGFIYLFISGTCGSAGYLSVFKRAIK